jgi:outer membrane protein OmpA-like peptidoglycan-associated protein
MSKFFKKVIVEVALVTTLLGVTACATTTANSRLDNNGDTRRVDRVVWNNQIDSDISAVLAKQVASDEVRLIFVRKSDNDPEQTSANIAINNRFQVSLHPGNYTAVNSCVGTNQISAHATGFKDNNLLAEQKDYELVGGQTYFFYVDMDESGQGSLNQITTDSALPLLENKRYQTHQISRVVPNCPVPVIATTPPVKLPPVVEQPAVLAEKITIDLEVLFETDKAIVRPEYDTKIAELAEFMVQYPNTIATIEGHTDSRSSDSYNQALSQRRVDAVKARLISQFNIKAERLSAIGYGETQPRASNDTVEGRQLNRRVIAVVEEGVRH